MSAPLVIETHDLTRRFGALTAVQGVSLAVHRGEIFGVLGPNGAGKSTTIRMLCGILDPTSGSGRVVGYDIGTEPERIKERIGYMTQRFSLYEDLTVRENMEFYAGIYALRGAAGRARIAEVLARSGLEGRTKQLAGTLSGGWKQRVALACATLHAPPLLFLDEPTAGVDPVSRRDFWDQIHQLAAQGTTVLVTTHYMDEAERCHRLAFIFRGTLLDVGTPQEIVDRAALQVCELHVDDGHAAAATLRAHPEVEEVAHYGPVLRVAVRGAHDPIAFSQEHLGRAGLTVHHGTRSRATVEDAFVAMVRRDDAARGA